MRRLFGTSASLAAVLLALGCRFDPMGLSVPARDGSSPDQTTPPAADLKVHETLPTLEDTGPQPDHWSPTIDSAPPADTQPPPPPPDFGPVFDSIPWCGPQNCAGCCTQGGTVCSNGNDNALCGQGGVACADCVSQQQACQNFACGGCVSSAQCAGEAVCLDPGPNSMCVDAYNRKYNVMLVSAKLNKQTKWDSMSSPDPFGKITVGSNYGYTNEKSNTYDPVWNQYLPDATITNITVVKVDLWDDDGFSDQYIGKVEISPPVPLSVLKAGEYIYQATSGAILEMTIKFTPRP